MTKEEALELLDVADGTPSNEIKKKYQELYSDYQLRLTNAPTPVLKKLYSGNLTKLESAFKLLCPNDSIDDVQDLPSAEPNYQTGAPQRAKVESKPRVGPEARRKREEQAKEKKGASPFMLAIAGVAILAIAGAIYLFIAGGKTQETLTMAESKISELEAIKADSERRLAPIQNGSFKIKNGTDRTFILMWYSATYVTEDGQFVTFDMEDHADSRKCISPVETFQEFKPGRTITLNHFHNQDPYWDGSVVFYSLQLDNPSYTASWYFTGVWNEDVDGNELVLNPPLRN